MHGSADCNETDSALFFQVAFFAGKDVFKSKAVLPWTMYNRPGETVGEEAKRYSKVHYGFKYKILIPAVY